MATRPVWKAGPDLTATQVSPAEVAACAVMDHLEMEILIKTAARDSGISIYDYE